MASSSSSINWAELPSELTSSILLRLSVVEMLQNAQKVCRAWRRVCKDPSMWRKINLGNYGIIDYNIEIMCRHAVDRNEGGLVEISIEHFGNDSLFTYIADRLWMCNPITGEGLVNAVTKLPFLEDLEIQDCDPQLNLKAIGHSCPLLKTLKVNCWSFRHLSSKCDDNDALAIAETMPQLSYLGLLGNRLTNTGLNAIPDNLHHLEHLDLRLCFNVNIAGDMKKRCLERIKDLRCADDSTADHPMDVPRQDNDSITEFFNANSDDIDKFMSAINLALELLL